MSTDFSLALKNLKKLTGNYVDTSKGKIHKAFIFNSIIDRDG